jgi:uncharacterized membrane protein YuzA (DUF378 family)
MMFDRFESADQTYYKKLLFKLAMVLIVVGAVNWLLIGIFDFNLVTGIFGDSIITKIIYICVGLSAVAVMFDRDTYLPFLGPMVAPCSVLENRVPPGATRDVTITVKPNSKVLYWASEPASAKLEKINSWKEAYLQYDNAGVATSNGDGIAVLKVREPQAYTVPIKGRLSPHVHYRVCGEAGWMGKIHTVFVESKVEGFEDKKLAKTSDKQYKFDISDTAASIY